MAWKHCNTHYRGAYHEEQTSIRYTAFGSAYYTQFIYLRARWLDPSSGRFLSPDTWTGSIQQPSSLHKYLYVSANPINSVDPSGLIEEGEADDARKIIQELSSYSVIIQVDFGWEAVPQPRPVPSPSPQPTPPGTGEDVKGACAKWVKGNWRSVWELEQVKAGVVVMADEMGGAAQFSRKVGRTFVSRGPDRYGYEGNTNIWGNITFYKYTFDDINKPGHLRNDDPVRNTVVHEFAHAWDTHNDWAYSRLMKEVTGSIWKWQRVNGWWWWKYEPVGEPTGVKNYGGPDLLPYNPREDWAASVAYVLFPLENHLELGSTREAFVRDAFAAQNIAAFEAIYSR